MLLVLTFVSFAYLDAARARKARQNAFEQDVPLTKELLALFANPQLSRQAQQLGLRPLSFGQDIKRARCQIRAPAACRSTRSAGGRGRGGKEEELLGGPVAREEALAARGRFTP